MLSPWSNLHSKERNRSPPLLAGRGGGGGAQLCPAQAQGRARGAGARDPQETRIWRSLASTDPAPPAPAPGGSSPRARAHCCSADSAITLSSTCPAGGPVSFEAGLSAARAAA